MQIQLKNGLQIQIMPSPVIVEDMAARWGWEALEKVLLQHFSTLAKKEFDKLSSAGLSTEALQAIAQTWRPGDASEYLKMRKKVSKVTREEKAALRERLK